MKVRYLLVFALAAATLVVGCGKKDGNHAPVCPYGQVLTYGDNGYSCQFVSLNQSPYQYGMCSQNTQPGVLTPPIQQCIPDSTGEPQTLVNWYGAWLCYKNRTIFPSGDNSPGGRTPPPGVGGEYCSGGNYFGGQFGNGQFGNNQFGTTAAGSCAANMQVTCSPGYECIAGGATPGASANPNGYLGNLGTGLGQPGTCQFTGYHGSY